MVLVWVVVVLESVIRLVGVIGVATDWEVIRSPSVGHSMLTDPSVSLKLIQGNSILASVLQQSLE